jgi:hypothetical protein
MRAWGVTVQSELIDRSTDEHKRKSDRRTQGRKKRKENKRSGGRDETKAERRINDETEGERKADKIKSQIRQSGSGRG